ncbi:hypothetical protein [Reichenbachiella versicolor]|uniref:hypothetical protein n=1 Tax=Reichenbachiella versicolor TaxID=1821036 RepID=UPI000D6DED51|nr:hypothetical protein [Reichenbachiella versicolor]
MSHKTKSDLSFLLKVFTLFGLLLVSKYYQTNADTSQEAILEVSVENKSIAETSKEVRLADTFIEL